MKLTSNWLVVASIACSALARSGGVRAAEPDYDELAADGLQLAVNASFEAMDRAGEKPAGWGVERDVRGDLSVVTDSRGSHHGAVYVTFAPRRRTTLYGSLNAVPVGRVRCSLWARGKGRFHFNVALTPPRWRLRQVGLHCIRSEWYEVDSEEWTHFTHELDVPAKATFRNAPTPETPEKAGIRLGTEGRVSFDEVSVVSVPALMTYQRRRAARAGEPGGLAPSLTIPKLGSAPTIDGEIGEDEWAAAAAVTGFTQLNVRTLATRQAVVYVAYDDERLYVAFRCPHRGTFGAGRAGERDAHLSGQTESVEVWLQPPGRGYVQFMGNPAGGIMDRSEEGGFKWNGKWDFANQVAESQEAAGGVLLFAQKTWTAEVAVAFADLGVDPPKRGETWRMNFTRDFSVPKGERRQDDDWASWAPIKGKFANAELFGRVTFGGKAPAVQVTSVGDLTNGDIAVAGRVVGGSAQVRVRTRAAEGETGKTLSFKKVEVETPGTFVLEDTLKVAGATDVTLEIRAERTDTGELLARSVIPFTATAALKMKLVPVTSEGLVYAAVDVSRLPIVSEAIHLKAEVCRGSAATGVAAETDWAKDRRTGDLKIDIGNLAPGEYDVKAFVSDARGREPIASAISSFVLPEKPEWLGNGIGISDAVPAPWTPVEVDGNRVRVIGREYVLGSTGLPQQITSAGEELFAAHPRLRTVIAGKEMAWECRPLAEQGRRDAQVVWGVYGTAGPLRLEGTLTVEYDGFALWDVEISGRGPATVDLLALEFPFKEDRALYARGANAASFRAAYAACLYETKRPNPDSICDRPFSDDGWKWPEAWCHRLFVGDDFRGLEVLCETQQFLRGRRRTEIHRNAGAHALRVYLVDGPHEMAGPLRYQYVYQATPVRPRTADPKKWHITYWPRRKEAFIKRLYVATDYMGLKWISYPETYHDVEKTQRKNRYWQEAGVKIVPYWSVQGVTTEAPDLRPYNREWESHPVQTIGGTRGGWVCSCISNKSFADYMVWAVHKVVNELGYDGLYLDVSGVHACKNHYHGCGWTDEDGKWHPTVNVLDSRAIYKRLYNVLKEHDPPAIFFRHGMPVAAVAGFVDTTCQGEDWGVEGTRQYDRLTPDIFRAKEMRIQYGTPYTWYSYHHEYRGERYGGRIPLCTMLCYTLPHRTLLCMGEPGMWPVWDALDPFWTPETEFIPYWDPQTPIASEDDDILASVYVRRDLKKALLVATNWSRDWKRVDMCIDTARLGLGRELKVSRAVDHPILEPKDPPDGDPMVNAPLAYRGGRLPLHIDGLNLEIVLIESE